MMKLDIPAPDLAPRLIGCRLRIGEVTGVIMETEAYQGEEDQACHARNGKTPRSAGLYAAPGTLYIYLTYGVHELLNIVCDTEGIPAAALIRAVHITRGEGIARARTGKPTAKLEQLANGPGKLTKALGLTREFHGTSLGAEDCPLQLFDPPDHVPELEVGPRVGLGEVPEPWKSKPWRWWQAGYPVVRYR